MNARITQRTDGLRNSFAASSAGTFTTRTDDPSLSLTMVPMLTVVLGFGKQSGLRALSTPPALPRRAAEALRLDDRATDLAESAESTVELPAEARAAEASAETNQPDKASDGDPPPFRTERRHRSHDVPEAAAAEPEPEVALPALAETAELEAAETAEHSEPEPEKPAHPNRLEMTIDSLPHHELTEPIPIAIDPLGDTIFTASMSNLDISATGNSIGEGLLLLKEQIAFVYGDLSRRPNLTADQKTTLQMLHTYIRPNGPKKPEWF